MKINLISIKGLLLTFGIKMLFSSCTKYQYVTIGSNLPQNESNQYFVENDTLTVTYSFVGYDCPIRIEVYNKIDQPLFIDWSKSALILDNRRYSYWIDESILSGSFNTYGVQSGDSYLATSGNISGKISRQEKISFLPPRSGLNVNPLRVTDSFLKTEGAESVHKIGNIVTKYNFSEEKAPLVFRSYLTVSTDEAFTQPVIFDDTFYSSQIYDTNNSPELELMGNPNKYYVVKSRSKGGSVFAWTTLSLLVLIGALASSSY